MNSEERTRKVETGVGVDVKVWLPQGDLTDRKDLRVTVQGGSALEFVELVQLAGVLQQLVREYGPGPLNAISTRRKGFVTLSDYGIVDGLSGLPNGGFDFGPDSVQPNGKPTETRGVAEAHAYAAGVGMRVLCVHLLEQVASDDPLVAEAVKRQLPPPAAVRNPPGKQRAVP